MSPISGEERGIKVSNIVVSRLEFTEDQEQMIRRMYAGDATAEEFGGLMEIAKVRKLNPLLRHIHFVKRSAKVGNKYEDVWSCQASIDGLRVIAERTGKYNGQGMPEFVTTIVGDKERPVLCRVAVYRKDWDHPVIGEARYEEYVQKKSDGTVTKFWKEKPFIMLAKCAEAIALRKAFPEDAGGLYTADEMPDDVIQITSDGEVIEPKKKSRLPAKQEHAVPALPVAVKTKSEEVEDPVLAKVDSESVKPKKAAKVEASKEEEDDFEFPPKEEEAEGAPPWKVFFPDLELDTDAVPADITNKTLSAGAKKGSRVFSFPPEKLELYLSKGYPEVDEKEKAIILFAIDYMNRNEAMK